MNYAKIIPLIITMVLIGCAGLSGEKKNSVINGVDWMLSEIKTPSRTIVLNRQKFEAEGMPADMFSLRFDKEKRLSGKAAPNRFFTECNWGDNSTLTLKQVASTQMFSFKEQDQLKEQDFFNYLAKVQKYSITPEGYLELFISPDGNGQSTVLIFKAKK
jgi:heat shock protein HslJ